MCLRELYSGGGLVSGACPAEDRAPLASSAHHGHGKGCSSNKDSHVRYGNPEHDDRQANTLLLSVIELCISLELVNELPDSKRADIIHGFALGLLYELR